MVSILLITVITDIQFYRPLEIKRTTDLFSSENLAREIIVAIF